MIKTTSFQMTLMEALDKKPMGVKDIVQELGASESYIRNQIKLLEETDRVEKVDQRFPYMYRVPKDSPVLKHKAAVTKAKADLMSSDESANPFVKVIKKAPRKDWHKAVESLEIISEAIRQLDAEGKLIDTL